MWGNIWLGLYIISYLLGWTSDLSVSHGTLIECASRAHQGSERMRYDMKQSVKSQVSGRVGGEKMKRCCRES